MKQVLFMLFITSLYLLFPVLAWLTGNPYITFGIVIPFFMSPALNNTSSMWRSLTADLMIDDTVSKLIKVGKWKEAKMLKDNPEARQLYIDKGASGLLPSLELMDRDQEHRDLVSYVQSIEVRYDDRYTDGERQAYLEGLRKVKEYYEI